MKKPARKRLSLSKSTLRNLNSDQLRYIGGGDDGSVRDYKDQPKDQTFITCITNCP